MSDAPGLEVGETAPDFTADLVFPDGEVAPTSLSELLEDSPVLLTFYTVDFSPDCIEEWCSFRDFDWFTANDDVQVVGISKSRSYLHKRFISYLDLSFPLFSDPDLTVAEKFKVKYRALNLFARSRRSCFLVDTDRTVQFRWLGEHWLDPTRDTPPVGEIHEALMEILAAGDDESDSGGAFA
ncbi:peroxiredoxin family protein [Halosegnis sp.]|uniref:peroxiredoxin family protein n=1 Tax=Halosegnis sp. TaxID=2864959 RepID=UPI0035D4617D